jgi:hypothetical protein
MDTPATPASALSKAQAALRKDPVAFFTVAAVEQDEVITYEFNAAMKSGYLDWYANMRAHFAKDFLKGLEVGEIFFALPFWFKVIVIWWATDRALWIWDMMTM